MVKDFLCPVSDTLKASIIKFREELSSEIHNPVPVKRYIITGPSSLNDPIQARACARWLRTKVYGSTNEGLNMKNNKLPDKIKKIFDNSIRLRNLDVAMNLNINNERRSSGDVYLSQTLFYGIVNCRVLLLNLAEEIPLMGDIGDPMNSRYLNDLFGLGVVSSQNIESQVHRELASGVPYPAGFNSSAKLTSLPVSILGHKFQKATDALLASADPHYFLSVTNLGNIAITSTLGNKDGFIIIPVVYNSILVSIDHLVSLIDDLLAKIHIPKVILDLGTPNESNRKSLLNFTREVLSSPITNYILGFMIDSGDHYVPEDFEDEDTGFLTSKDDESLIETDLLSEISERIGTKRLSMRGRFLKTMKASYTKVCNSFEDKQSQLIQYQNFIQADLLINEIDDLLSNI